MKWTTGTVIIVGLLAWSFLGRKAAAVIALTPGSTPPIPIGPTPATVVVTNVSQETSPTTGEQIVSVTVVAGGQATGYTFGYDPSNVAGNMANYQYLAAIPVEQRTAVNIAQLEAVTAVLGM